jgi:hypothetical protein
MNLGPPTLLTKPSISIDEGNFEAVRESLNFSMSVISMAAYSYLKLRLVSPRQVSISEIAARSLASKSKISGKQEPSGLSYLSYYRFATSLAASLNSYQKILVRAFDEKGTDWMRSSVAIPLLDCFAFLHANLYTITLL